MIIKCPDSICGSCTETQCGRCLSNPYQDGVDDNLQPTYTAICCWNGELRYFHHLPPEPEELQPDEPSSPLPAVVVEVSPLVVNQLSDAFVEKCKSKGGRPKRSKRDGNYLSQGDVAKMFGKPCNTNMVANWERYHRTNQSKGAKPPSASVNGKWESYRAELRENCTGDNHEILAAIIETFKSCHTIKHAVKTRQVVHAANEETLYRMQHPDGRIRTENRTR